MIKTKKLKTLALVLAIAVATPMVQQTATTDTSIECNAKAKKVYVFYAKNSKKYHTTRSCRTLKRSKKIYKVTKAKAKKLGLTPCKVCH